MLDHSVNNDSLLSELNDTSILNWPRSESKNQMLRCP